MIGSEDDFGKSDKTLNEGVLTERDDWRGEEVEP